MMRNEWPPAATVRQWLQTKWNARRAAASSRSSRTSFRGSAPDAASPSSTSPTPELLADSSYSNYIAELAETHRTVSALPGAVLQAQGADEPPSPTRDDDTRRHFLNLAEIMGWDV